MQFKGSMLALLICASGVLMAPIVFGQAQEGASQEAPAVKDNQNQAAASNQAPATRYELVTAKAATSQSYSVLGSTVVPYRLVTFTAQIPGVVKAISGDVGSAFQQNALLLQIDDSQLLAKRNAVLAQMQMAQASVQTAQAQYQRELMSPRSRDIGAMPGFGMPAMFDRFAVRPFAEMMMNDYDPDVVRQTDLMNSASALQQAQAGVQQAYAQLQEIDAGLRDANALAPFEGMIMEKLVEVGDTVQPGQPLLRYGYVKRMRLQADVPSGLVGNLSQNMQVAVDVDGAEPTVATVSQIYPVADPNGHTVIVKFDLPEGMQASPGMYAEIRLPENRPSANAGVLIPSTALISGRSLSSVLVVNGQRAELRLVRLGSERGDQVEVVSGLNEGDQLINNPPANAKSMNLNVVNEG